MMRVIPFGGFFPYASACLYGEPICALPDVARGTFGYLPEAPCGKNNVLACHK